MANLSLYNAKKFRAAFYLNQGNPDEARNAIRIACCYWQKYTSIMDERYIGVDLQRNSDFSDWHENDSKALQDFTGIGGVGSPKCADDVPWVYIKSPGNNTLFVEPADVVLDVLADAGENSIERVELILNDTLVDTDTDDPYGFELNGLMSGSYTLEAVAHDDQGGSDSYRVEISVNNPDSMNKVPWMEDFSLPDGSTYDNGPTSWNSSRSDGNLLVQNNVFVVNDAGTEGTLTTGSIDISEGPVDISLDLWSDGNLESDDYVRLYMKLDDGPEVLVGSKTGNQNTRTTIRGNATASRLVLVIRTRVSYSSEYYYMDNLSITYTEEPENQAPEISFASPGNGAEYMESDTVVVNLEASDPDGIVAWVELRINGILSATLNQPPFSYSFTGLTDGDYAITASAYDDDGASSHSTINIVIRANEKLSQTITFPELPAVQVGDPDFDPGATASSGLEVSYSSSDAQVASIEDGKIHVLKVGISTITASQQGNETYDPAPEISRTLTVSNATSAEGPGLKVNLFPNPATNEVYIDVPDEYALSLVHLTGIEVIHRSHLAGMNEIDVANLERGVYFMKIKGVHYSAIRKVVLQ